MPALGISRKSLAPAAASEHPAEPKRLTFDSLLPMKGSADCVRTGLACSRRRGAIAIARKVIVAGVGHIDRRFLAALGHGSGCSAPRSCAAAPAIMHEWD
jgi:hypothetical protein